MRNQRTNYRYKKRKGFYEVVNEAIRDIQEHGYDSQARIDGWLQKIESAAREHLIPIQTLSLHLKKVLSNTFQRETADSVLRRRHPGIPEFTLRAIKPKLYAELDRRILASANLIVLNREQSIAKTLQGLAGWATSVPKGGTKGMDKEAVLRLRRGISGLPFVERRVVIDQGHKLVAAINDIVAVDGGAIAGEWHSHWRETGYDFRPDHKARDLHVYLIRNSWAYQREYIKKSGFPYTDQITAPGFEIYCRCFYRYIYNLRDIPEIMLTKKGRDALENARERLAF